MEQRRFCSELMMYLILRTVSTFTPATNPRSAEAFANAMMATDLLNWTTRGVFGGAYNKVVRWAFEKQGVWRSRADPPTVTGQAPPVDVYIDDGRGGGYGFQSSYWEHPGVWNRLQADGGTPHQEPRLGQTNYAYARVRNRGIEAAGGITVRAYQGGARSGLVWPGDFAPLDTGKLAVRGSLAAGDVDEVVVGPFSWTPSASQDGRLCLLMAVEALGDASNLVHFGRGEWIEDWRLTPNDNNIAQRAMVPAQ